MRVLELFRMVRSREMRAAWFVAVAADTIQIVVLPVFAPGGISPADTAVDLGVAFILSKLMGWHWAFLPTLIAELIPGFDLFPTWTAAVGYVTWQQARTSQGDDIRDIHDVRDVTKEHLSSLKS